MASETVPYGEKLEEAEALVKGAPEKAIEKLWALVAVPLEADNAEGIRVKELAIHSLGVLCSEMKLSKG
jgi:hypothetical protein